VGPGDVILIEQQTSVCGGTQFGPSEWQQSVFDAIAAATALGIVVVEAAGNGGVNLDDPACGDRFDRNVRESGAIIVGAGSPSSHSRLGFSSYGSRVDLQGWGTSVTTAGYGGLFNPGDIRQRYTSSFNGTSSASPVVTGAVLAVQGAVMAMGLAPVDPIVLRQALVDTGTPQDNPAEHIGPLPSIAAALEAVVDLAELTVPVDILPGRCPNRLLVVRGRSFRFLQVAIVGTDTFDVSEVNADTARLGGVAPKRLLSRNGLIRDVATPFKPFIGKMSAEDCTRDKRDGFDDLLLIFDGQAIVDGIGAVSDGEVVVVALTAELSDGTRVRGEDVVLIRAPLSEGRVPRTN
jgi:hypothetical protein